MSARERGVSLVIALLMLTVIGLASAAIMRNAIASHQVAHGHRLQMEARQAAQFALRFCERQLAMVTPSRSVGVLAAAAPPAWSSPRAWATSGAGAAHTLLPADMGGAVPPRIAPQCLVEATGLADVYTITARGFSADFRSDDGTGATRAGAVVWLQSTIQAEGDPSVPGVAGPGVPAAPPVASAGRRRVWQQLLTPPF